MNRRLLLKKAVCSIPVLLSPSFLIKKNTIESLLKESSPKLSLAQWSLHRQFYNGIQNPKHFASIAANTYGINAVEYISQLYRDFKDDNKFWLEMKQRSDDIGVNNLLIMIDDEGDLGSSDTLIRKEAIQNHCKWINTAKILGCQSIRVNVFGDANKQSFLTAAIDSVGQLAEYSLKENINVLIENHGLYSSDADLVVEIINQIDMANCGTMPDFGNWCQSKKWGSINGECQKSHDIYEGVSKFLPYAKAVSAKAYNFDSYGNETLIDFYKMISLIKQSNFQGYIGIEYEGGQLSEYEGILATKTLIQKAWDN